MVDKERSPPSKETLLRLTRAKAEPLLDKLLAEIDMDLERVFAMLGEAGTPEAPLLLAAREKGPKIFVLLAMDKPPRQRFTAREREVIDCLCEGLADKGIAARLKISKATASDYVQRIFRKINIHSRSAVALQLLREGLLS